jgi:23S rRNA pseudouridine1911/1915/1917 synthase
MPQTSSAGDRARERAEVPADRAGVRLDKFLAELPGVASRRRAREALESGKVTIDGLPVSDAAQALAAGSVVEVEWNRPGTGRLVVEARKAISAVNLGIAYEDDDIVCVDKPAGLLTDAATREQRRERDTVVHRLRTYLRPQGVTPFVGHRIDRDTSGLVAFAKHERAWERLRAQFHARTPERVYLAILQGIPVPSEGTWTDDMVWDERELIQRLAKRGERGLVRASARYRVIRTFASGLAQVEVQLVSGRRNQIRLHAMLRGYPLVGERLYLAPGHQRRGPDLARHALHAWRLAFDQPMTGARIALESPLPPDLAGLIAALSR